MILYSWLIGLCLNEKQHGIQSGHCAGDLFLKHRENKTELDRQYWDWAENHKTVCLLNGINYRGLLNMVEMFDTPENPYPWGTFNEDFDSLGGLMTCVSICLPERIYARARMLYPLPATLIDDVVAELSREGYTQWEIALMLKLPTFRLV